MVREFTQLYSATSREDETTGFLPAGSVKETSELLSDYIANLQADARREDRTDTKKDTILVKTVLSCDVFYFLITGMCQIWMEVLNK